MVLFTQALPRCSHFFLEYVYIDFSALLYLALYIRKCPEHSGHFVS